MIYQSIPRSEDEESLLQEGRLQSVAVMTESLRLDISSMQRNIETHNATIDLLLERGVADRDERKVMVAKITEQDVRIGDLNSTIAVQGVRIAEQDVRIAEQDVRIAEQDVRIDRQERNSDLIVLFDLISLYRFYFVLPKILDAKKYANWGALCEAILDATDLYEDKKMTADDYNSLVEEWQTYSTVDIFLIRQWSTERNDVAHTDMRSVPAQQKFLTDLSRKAFADSEIDSMRVLLLDPLNKLTSSELRRKK
jgi:hypothetical protein